MKIGGIEDLLLFNPLLCSNYNKKLLIITCASNYHLRKRQWNSESNESMVTNENLVNKKRLLIRLLTSSASWKSNNCNEFLNGNIYKEKTRSF